jgi:hypothetical protein
MMLTISFSYLAFIMLRYIPSSPSFFSAFIMKGCWILSKPFLHLLKQSCEFCLHFMCCTTFINFHMLNHPGIPEMDPTWS